MTNRVRGDLVLVLVTIIAAFGWLLSKKVLDFAVPPFLFIGVRFLLAGLVLGAIVQRTVRSLSKKQWKIAATTGTLFGLAMLLWIQGLYYSSHLGEAAFISSLSVIMIPLIGRLIFGDRIPPFLLIPLLMALGGMALLTLGDKIQLELSQLFLLSAALLFALQLVLTARFVSSIPAMGLAAIQMTCVGIVGLVAGVIAAYMNGETLSLDWGMEAWLWLLASCFFTSLLRFALQMYALKFSSATNAGMILVLEPVWTTLLATVFFGELMAINQWAGCGLIFAAIVVFQLISLHKRRYPSRAVSDKPVT